MKVLLYEQSKIPTGYETDLHSHSFWHLDYFRKGSGTAKLLFYDKQIVIEECHAILIPANFEHKIIYQSSCNLFTIRFIPDNGESDFLNATVPYIIANSYSHGIFSNIFRENCSIDELEMRIISSYIAILLYQLAREYSISSFSYHPDNDERILNAISFIRDHLHNKLDINKLAKYSGMSNNHFIRKFKEITKSTPKQYIVKLKMEKATQLLQYSDITVTEIAELLSYPDIHTFSKAFKKQFKTSPGNYKKSVIQYKNTKFKMNCFGDL